MVTLGINWNHPGSSAALFVDEKLVFAIAEERLNRHKYYSGFPVLAIKAALDYAGLGIEDVTHVAVGGDSRCNRAAKIRYALRHPLDTLQYLYHSVLASGSESSDVRSEFTKHELELHKSVTLRWYEHHLCHLSTSYFFSPFSNAVAVSLDGSGDFVSATFAKCEAGNIQVLGKEYLPQSLGNFYFAICQFIGYDRYGDEGKVMGLAAVGDPTVYSDLFNTLVNFTDRGIQLNKRFLRSPFAEGGMKIDDSGAASLPVMYTKELENALGVPRKRNSEITERDANIAAALQKRFEDMYFSYLNFAFTTASEFSTNIVLAGGCALNSVANGMIQERTPFERSFVYPASGDDGLAVGAAALMCKEVSDRELKWESNVYLGQEFTNHELENALDERNLSYVFLEGDLLLEKVCDLLESGNVIGWFQGRSEWGPRALCNRSIIADPSKPDMKDQLNARIKHRESFRPFAPVVRAEKLRDVFYAYEETPYMLHVYKFREQHATNLPCVVHEDHTGRVQTLTSSENPLFYSLLEAFEERTGVPSLVNTSFNENEPVVERPEEAIDCFLRTKMDALVLGNYIVVK